MTHPEAFGDLCHAAAILWLAEALDDGAFEITDLYGLLLRHPVFGGAEIVLRLDEDETEFCSAERAASEPLRAGGENGKLGLSHHPVYLHRGRMRNETRRVPCQPAGREVGIAGVFGSAPKLGRNDNEHAWFEARNKAAPHGLVKKATGKMWAEAGNLLSICKGKGRLGAIIQSCQQGGRLGADSLSSDVMFCAHLFAHRAICDT